VLVRGQMLAGTEIGATHVGVTADNALVAGVENTVVHEKDIAASRC
jgi:hypothetical protein